MTRFLLKGLFRDRSRSLFPILIVATGVFITVTAYGWLKGATRSFADIGARYDAGHLKVMTRAYASEADQSPIELAILHCSDLTSDLQNRYPGINWTPRIKFGGLLDIADDKGETSQQAMVAGLALDLLDPDGFDVKLLQIEKALVRGNLPQTSNDILISDELAETMDIQPGMTVSFLGGTMHGGMTVVNFTVTGTVQFGIKALDRGAVLTDISGAQNALDMQDACSEILGFFPEKQYPESAAAALVQNFNTTVSESDEFAPVMVTLLQQNDLQSMMDYMDIMGVAMNFIFIFIMSLILWNAGLMAGLRRYGELGVRLAIGESKIRIYRSLLMEAGMIGLAGSILGTLLGVIMTLYLQETGIDISASMDRFSLFMPNVMRGRLTPMSFFVGFIPGCIAMVLGSAIAGLGVFRRETAVLFKELES